MRTRLRSRGPAAAAAAATAAAAAAEAADTSSDSDDSLLMEPVFSTSRKKTKTKEEEEDENLGKMLLERNVKSAESSRAFAALQRKERKRQEQEEQGSGGAAAPPQQQLSLEERDRIRRQKVKDALDGVPDFGDEGGNILGHYRRDRALNVQRALDSEATSEPRCLWTMKATTPTPKAPSTNFRKEEKESGHSESGTVGAVELYSTIDEALAGLKGALRQCCEGEGDPQYRSDADDGDGKSPASVRALRKLADLPAPPAARAAALEGYLSGSTLAGAVARERQQRAESGSGESREGNGSGQVPEPIIRWLFSVAASASVPPGRLVDLGQGACRTLLKLLKIGVEEGSGGSALSLGGGSFCNLNTCLETLRAFLLVSGRRYGCCPSKCRGDDVEGEGDGSGHREGGGATGNTKPGPPRKENPPIILDGLLHLLRLWRAVIPRLDDSATTTRLSEQSEPSGGPAAVRSKVASVLVLLAMDDRLHSRGECAGRDAVRAIAVLLSVIVVGREGGGDSSRNGGEGAAEGWEGGVQEHQQPAGSPKAAEWIESTAGFIWDDFLEAVRATESSLQTEGTNDDDDDDDEGAFDSNLVSAHLVRLVSLHSVELPDAAPATAIRMMDLLCVLTKKVFQHCCQISDFDDLTLKALKDQDEPTDKAATNLVSLLEGGGCSSPPNSTSRLSCYRAMTYCLGALDYACRCPKTDFGTARGLARIRAIVSSATRSFTAGWATYLKLQRLRTGADEDDIDFRGDKAEARNFVWLFRAITKKCDFLQGILNSKSSEEHAQHTDLDLAYFSKFLGDALDEVERQAGMGGTSGPRQQSVQKYFKVKSPVKSPLSSPDKSPAAAREAALASVKEEEVVAPASFLKYDSECEAT